MCHPAAATTPTTTTITATKTKYKMKGKLKIIFRNFTVDEAHDNHPRNERMNDVNIFSSLAQNNIMFIGSHSYTNKEWMWAKIRNF